MIDESDDRWKLKVEELKQELQDREADLATYRRELAAANQKLEKLIREIAQDLQIAQHIQKLLLPTELPSFPGFEFSSKFVASPHRGGDYFDVFEQEDRTRFGLIVASSSGHSMSALLLSVLLKLTGRLEARRGAEPHQVLKLIWQEMKQNLAEGERADLFYGVFDRKNFVLSYCRAGSGLALYQPYPQGELKALPGKLPPLATGFELPKNSETLQLNPRDRLVFCTPGVVEARNLAGETFGRERVLRSILGGPTRGVHELRNEILYQVEQFLAGQLPPRDMTVVVMEIKDRVIKLAKA